MEDLEEKTALITGASRGIGAQIARDLAAAGTTVGVNFPPGEHDNAHEVITTIQNNGGEGFALEGDVSSADDVPTMVEEFVTEYGTVDILVNNAGGSIEKSQIEDMPETLWDKVVDVNLKGTFLASKAVMPLMRDTGSGSIINIASQLGFLGDANQVHYCAAKGGVISFTRALAREAAPDIRVNAIAPGPIRTGIRGEITKEYLENRTASIPLGRLGEPEEVASTALFLASDQSSYFTGQTLSPDGGEAMH
jgi:3-oxoacyl-[acyl-carrier protein] reductase